MIDRVQVVRRFVVRVAVSTLAVFLTVASVFAQGTHPKKSIFTDVEDWPATKPGEVKLKNFSPFRAVYDRTYRQASGPKRGEARNDRVIISAENTGWDGRKAVAITLIDSGIAKHSDTNARVLTMFADLNDLSLLFEIGPVPGSAKNYYIGRVDAEKISMSRVMTGDGKHEARNVPTKAPGFGPNAWVMASMGLKKGLKISLAPVYSPRGNSLTSATYGHIVGTGSFVDGSGKKHQSWILETSRNLSSPRVSHVHLIDRPPYYLGTETVNLDTGERRKFVWLRSVSMLE